jgi:two-component system response regulator DevR
MIDVVFADHNELFHVGMKEILGETDDVYLIAQPRSGEQLLSILEALVPHILILSTQFIPMFTQIEPLLQQRQTALLLLAEDDDRVAYARWLPARGIVYRSMDGTTLVDAMRRIARGEFVIQNHSSDIRHESCADDTESPVSSAGLRLSPAEDNTTRGAAGRD